MTTRTDAVVVGIFEHQAQAEAAVGALWKAGFPHDRIDMVTKRQGVVPATPNLEEQMHAADGAVVGAVAGAGAGAVAGALVGSALPGVGTVLGGLGGAALGAASGTFVGPFVALEVPEDHARHYARAVDEGKTLVVVREPDRANEARALLRAHGGAMGVGEVVEGADNSLTPAP
jgi:hypothetical protein